MNKITFLFIALFLSVFSFGQAPIATVDRLNGPGPTATDNVASMSSIGLTRGAGVVQVGATGATSFISNNFTIGGDLSVAQTNNDYITWSIKANTAFEIVLEDLDIRLRRNANGPTDWQLFYSLDDFTTPGIAIGSAQPIPANINTSFNLATINGSNLGINSGTSGRITFRLYAWGAIANNGNLRVLQQNSWSISPAVPNPGIRMIGTIIPPAAGVSFDSDIIASTAIPIQQNIDYKLYTASSGLDFTNSVPLGAFNVQDGGGSSDADSNPTILESIEFVVANSEDIAALAIFVPGPFFFPVAIAEETNVTSLTSFSGLNIVASDNGVAPFFVGATFKTTVTDNAQVQLTINSAITPATGSSLFTEANAGGATTSIAGDDNRIEVTASQFQFVQQPTDGNELEIMLPYPIINAVDVNLNLDVDADILGINVTTVPSASIVPETYDMVAGEAILDQVVFTDSETGVALLASSGSISGTSDNFDINGPLVTIIEQNFDTATDWTYTADTFGDTTAWVAQTGHFNEIALTDATPLDNIFFDGDIFGENNLDASGDLRRIVTLDDVIVSGFSDMRVEFDWQVIGYANNPNDLQYRLRLNGSFAGGWQTFFNGSASSDVNDAQGRVKINIPDGTNSVGLLIRFGNRLATGYAGIDNIKIARTFSGLIYTNAGGWKNNISPDATTGASNVLVIDGTYSLSGNVEVNNITVQNEATVVIPTSQSLTVNGNMIVNGNLELNSSSNTYSSLIVNGNTFGEVTYFRHVNQLAATGSVTGDNDLIAAPVTSPSQDFLALRNANPDLPSGTIGGVPSFLFGPFNNNSNAFINYTLADDNAPIEAGVGYRSASIQLGGSNFVFKGNVETNASAIPINQGTGSIFNLVGNPYPSYITLAGFLAANNSEFDPLTSGVYGYDGDATDGFIIWNQAFSDANPNALIAPGQGFLVSSKVGGGAISFPSSMRSIGTADDFIAGRNAVPIAYLKLKITSNDQQFFTDLYFTDNATAGFDAGYDAAMFDVTPEFALYTHLIENNTGTDLAVQSVSYNALDEILIPLGVNANADTTISFSIEESTLGNDVEVYLEDQLAQTVTRLDLENYSLTSNTPLSSTGRFFINLTRQRLTIADELLGGLNLYVLEVPKVLMVEGLLAEPTKLNIVDLQGRIVKTANLSSNVNTQEIDLGNLNTGVYVVKIENNSQQKTQKIIIK